METRIIDIHCKQCGAPARYDIIRQEYRCGYCGGITGLEDAVREKKGFRKMQGTRLQREVKAFSLVKTSCTGCGAEVVFAESEALSGCPFCGRNLVRSEYLNTRGLPESIIPFAITEEEAKQRLEAWCRENKGKREASHLMPLIGELRGFYLPYELVRGPVHMKVSRMDGGGVFPCEGFMNGAFVNRSRQLDNLLLDGMEPFDPEKMVPFEFSYAAGQRVKISDVSDKELEERVGTEMENECTPAVRKTLETKAVQVRADVGSAVRLPVLLPVYYICRGDVMAAVNGQTGKVSVRAEKVSHYYFLPWWFKAILATAVVCAALFLCLWHGGMGVSGSLIISGMFAIVFLIIMLCLYSDTEKNSFSVEAGYKIFTSGSGDRRGRKEPGEGAVPERETLQPVFLQNIDGEMRPVALRFTTPGRVLKLVLLSVTAMFLPVIAALLLNGFDFGRLQLGGSAVWFCIAVPIVPVYVIKFGIVELYEHPLVYTIAEDGTKKRYKKRPSFRFSGRTILTILRVLFVPPLCFAVWFGIISFVVMVLLTSGSIE